MSLPSVTVYSHTVTFSDTFGEAPIKVTEDEYYQLNQLLTRKAHHIELHGLHFSWSQVKKVKRIERHPEAYQGATFDNLPLGDLAAKIIVEGQSVILRHFWKKSMETQQIAEEWYGYFLDGKEILVANDRAEQAIQSYMESAIGEVEMGKVMFSERHKDPCFAFLMPGA